MSDADTTNAKPRMGKKTLYLNLDDLERLQRVLERLPGNYSISSFLTEMLPAFIQGLEDSAAAMEVGGYKGLYDLLQIPGEELRKVREQAELMKEEKEQEGTFTDIPPKKTSDTVKKE